MSYLVPPTTTATRAPLATDDAGDGYRIGWIWVDTAARAVYMLADATTNAAVWLQVGVSLYMLYAGTAADFDYQQAGAVAAFAPNDVRVN
jgi:hypothetical protein